MHPVTALGAALYYDFSLVEDVAPLGRLLDALAIGDGPELKQFCVPLAPRREKETKVDRAKLFSRITSGELFSALVGRRGDNPDDEVVTVSVSLAPATNAQQENRAGYRFHAHVELGAAAVARRGVDAIVNALIAFANDVTPRAGVVFPASSAAAALGLATGTQFSDLGEQTNLVIRDIAYEVNVLADRIRTPEWGTFLAKHHVEKMGGIEALRALCPSVRELESGGAFLQLTKELDDAGIHEKRRALASALAPLLAP